MKRPLANLNGRSTKRAADIRVRLLPRVDDKLQRGHSEELVMLSTLYLGSCASQFGFRSLTHELRENGSSIPD